MLTEILRTESQSDDYNENLVRGNGSNADFNENFTGDLPDPQNVFFLKDN